MSYIDPSYQLSLDIYFIDEAVLIGLGWAGLGWANYKWLVLGVKRFVISNNFPSK